MSENILASQPSKVVELRFPIEIKRYGVPVGKERITSSVVKEKKER